MNKHRQRPATGFGPNEQHSKQFGSALRWALRVLPAVGVAGMVALVFGNRNFAGVLILTAALVSAVAGLLMVKTNKFSKRYYETLALGWCAFIFTTVALHLLKIY